MTTTKTSRLKIIAICSTAVAVALILFLTAMRLILVEFLAVDCSLEIRYGWYEELREYAEAHPDKEYPPMSSSPGVLFLDIESVRPQFITSWGNPFCIKADNVYKESSVERQFANPTLAYFGYALCNEDELLAFLEEYPKFIESGADFNADLPAPAGRGSFGGDQFLRLTSDMRQRQNSETSGIPILFEIPHYTAGKFVSRHWGGMAYSITLGSTLKSVKLGSTFPLTQAVVQMIGEIKARYRVSPSTI